MTLTNGRPAATAELEAMLQGVTQQFVAADTPLELESSDVAMQAQAAVQSCRDAAEHVREMGSKFLAIAQSVKTTGDALALDIENRADQFSKMVAMASEYAKQTHNTFEKERDRLDGFRMPGG